VRGLGNGHVTGIIAWLILAANAIVTSTVVVLLTFAFTALVDEPATAVALVVIVLFGVALDVGWKRVRGPGWRPVESP
jgi:hypothetical protein